MELELERAKSAMRLAFGESIIGDKTALVDYLRFMAGVAIGTKLGSRAMVFSNDSNLRITGTMHHLKECPSSRFFW